MNTGPGAKLCQNYVHACTFPPLSYFQFFIISEVAYVVEIFPQNKNMGNAITRLLW